MKKISKMKSSKLGTTGNTSLQAQNSTTLTNGKKTNGSSSASNVQDEVNLKILRDLNHVECNRYCFECGQRGPTYVDVTIGSFVCMTCSGLLRGITPPHRLKSISMASFTPEELELLKTRGNEYCRKVWLATHTSKDTQLISSDPDRLNALKSLMSAKYEQKRYYVDPSRLSRSELTEIQNRNSKPSPSSTHSNPSPLLNNLRSSFNSLPETTAGKSRLTTSMTLPDIKPLSSLDSGIADISTLSLTSNSSTSSPNSKNHHLHQPINFINNLLPNGQNNNTFGQTQSPWGESISNNEQEWTADFDDAFNKQRENSHSSSNNNQIQPPPPQLPQKFINGGFIPNVGNISLIPNSNSNSNGFLNHNNQNGNHGLIPNGNTSTSSSNGDKYAALKDLDSLFKQQGDGLGTSPSNLSSSMSVPVNLSASVLNNDNEWFNVAPSPPTQNPFQGVNGWSSSNGNTGGCGVFNTSGQNPHNPFYASGGASNGWSNGGGTFSSSNGTVTSGPSHIRNDQPMKTKGFNPFFTPTQPTTLTTNPNNPFL